MKKILGIIGGMGPMATADLYRKIVLNTKAGNDNGHIHTIIDSNTGIPDRTASILGTGECAAKELIASARRLETAGAQVLAIPCNTAHYYYDDICAAVGVPVLHMLRETAKLIKKSGNKVALLATDGTIKTGIYSRLFEEEGVDYITPDEAGQRAVMDIIYNGVKAGRADYDAAPFKAALDALISRGAQSFVLGCTELPIAFADYRLEYPVIDPTLVLAKTAIERCGYELK